MIIGEEITQNTINNKSNNSNSGYVYYMLCSDSNIFKIGCHIQERLGVIESGCSDLKLINDNPNSGFILYGYYIPDCTKVKNNIINRIKNLIIPGSDSFILIEHYKISSQIMFIECNKIKSNIYLEHLKLRDDEMEWEPIIKN